MKQSRLESFIERVCDVGSGFILAWCVWQFAIIPVIQYDYLTFKDTTSITIIFTVVSLIRGYVWRRIFNKQLPHLFATKIKKMFGSKKDFIFQCVVLSLFLLSLLIIWLLW